MAHNENGTEAPNTPTLFLIDCMAFVFRAYHALPPLSTPDGTPSGAVFGFCNMLTKLLDDEKPDHVAAVFDTAAPTFRKVIYPEYKANRPPVPEDLIPQFALIDRAVQAFNLMDLRLDGYEADDVIATVAVQARAAGMKVVIVSGDKDLMQLADEGTVLLDTMRNKTLGPAEVEKKFGVPPAKLGDWLALCGDSADNIPGVPGVGPKTATKLLDQFGDLERILGGIDAVKGKKLKERLADNAEQARLSRKLVELERACPLPVKLSDLARQEIDATALAAFYTEMGFGRLRERLSAEPGVGPAGLDRSLYQTILTEQELVDCVAEIRAAGACAVDTETTGLDPVQAHLVGISLCWAEGKACYIPLGHDYLGVPQQLPTARALELLEPLLCDPKFPKSGQNFKYDWIVLKQAGLEVAGFSFDTMLASYLLDASRNHHNLDGLASDHLGHTMLHYKEVAGKEPFSRVELAPATEYAAEDAEATFRLAQIMDKRLEGQERLRWLLDEMELPLAHLLARMELHGVALDAQMLRSYSTEVAKQLAEIQTEVDKQAGWEVNINSPKQLQKLLFDDMGLTAGRKTKTGYSTDADTLADLALEAPIAALIEEYRTLSKLKGTYLDALPRLVNPKTGRLHTSYNQAVAATGRLSSSSPNLQNIPIRTELGRSIRKAFVAPQGRVLLSADYSQVELRILAHLSGDPVLVEAFNTGQDVHTRTAVEVFGVTPEEVTSDQRRVAKAVNFGVIYGQSDWGLSRQLRIPRATARQYIESYFARYAGVQTFMDRLIEEARETRVVETLLGRRRPVPDITSKRRNVRMYAERMVRNTPIQGTAADLLKLAMLAVDRDLAQAKIDAPMILTVHDEVILEVKTEDVDRVTELVTKAMANATKLDVPLKVDVDIGQNWAEAHP